VQDVNERGHEQFVIFVEKKLFSSEEANFSRQISIFLQNRNGEFQLSRRRTYLNGPLTWHTRASAENFPGGGSTKKIPKISTKYRE